MDEISLYIENEVNDYRTLMEQKENKTKEQFFHYLLLGYSLAKYKKWVFKEWNDDDTKKMTSSEKKLEKLIDKKNKVKNNEKTEDFFKKIDKKRFKEVKKSFTDELFKYYQKRQEIAEKVPDKAEYLKEFVDKYDKQMAMVPYFKNGKVCSWHTLSDYTSMIFNTNLTRSGWNRTLTDAKKFGKTILYITAHPFACPRCMQYQGKFFSTKKHDKLPYIETAFEGGLGHPNCKHVPTLADSTEPIQDDTFNSPEWEEKYKAQQKLMAIQRADEKLNSDLRIYKELGNQTQVDKTTNKIRKLGEKDRELRLSLRN